MMTAFNLFLSLAVVIALPSVLAFKVVVKYPSNQVSGPLTLRGNGCGLSWNSGLPFSQVAPNTYSVDLDCSSSVGNILQFKPMIGDTWSVGSNFEAAISTNQSFVNSYPYFYTYSGAYTYLRAVYSPQLSNVRDMVIYLPPSYLENGYKSSYTTLVMHDGQNLFNASTSFGGLSWNCQSTLDGLITTGQMEEIIVVGVDNTPDRLNELTYSSDPKYGGGKGDIYLDFIRDTVLPLARSKFPIARDRSRLGILGSSLGGLISCYAGWTRTSEYGRAGCMSSSFWWNSEDFDNVILVKKPKPSQRETFYLDSGDSGDSQDDKVQTLSVMAHLQKLGYSLNQNLFYYLDKGGQHNEYFWGRRFWIPMTKLFPPALLTTEPL